MISLPSPPREFPIFSKSRSWLDTRVWITLRGTNQNRQEQQEARTVLNEGRARQHGNVVEPVGETEEIQPEHEEVRGISLPMGRISATHARHETNMFKGCTDCRPQP